MRILGIDPGIKGALAIHNGYRIEEMEIMPEDSSFAIDIILRWNPSICYLEKAQSSPLMGVTSAFTYGRGYGEILGILKALKLPHVLVRPTTWTKELHKDISGNTAKDKSKKAALSLFPYMNFLATPRSRTPHDGLMDAALLAEYGARQEYNKGRISKELVGVVPC